MLLLAFSQKETEMAFIRDFFLILVCILALPYVLQASIDAVFAFKDTINQLRFPFRLKKGDGDV